MDFVTLLGLTAATFTAGAFLPQTIKTWRLKSAKDVSFGTLLTYCISVFLWLIYGVYLQALPIILANLLALIFNLIILGLKMRYR